MLDIPMEIKDLLKSKKMVGDNRPTAGVILQGMSGSFDILGSGGIPKKTYIGWRDELNNAISTKSFSMFVPTQDGRFMTCFYHDGKLKVGYTPDERFFYEDYCLNPEEFIEYASISNPNTSENIIPLNTGWNITDPIPIYKRPDGKVIILITNPIADASNITGDSRIDCLISNSGNGDDFQYYSNVFRLTPIGITYLSTLGYGSINAIKTITGIRLIAVMTTQFKNSSALFSQVKIFTSDDFGYSWTQRYAIGAGIGFSLVLSIAQAAQIPSGEVYCSITWSSTGSNLLISRNYGDSWSNVSGWEDDFGDEQVESLQGSFYYDEATNTIYRHSSRVSADGIYKVESPTPEIVEDKSKWETVTSLDNPYHTNFKGDIGTHFRKQPSGNIALLNTDRPSSAFIWGWRIWQNRVQAKSITVDRSKGSASMVTVTIDNKDGMYSPDSPGIWSKILWLNKKITITMGYGAEQPTVFTGLIDEIKETNYPAELTIVARDFSKRALDQQPQKLVGDTTVYALLYENMPPEAIFTELAIMAGWAAEDIHVGITGVTIASIQFGHESIADCFQRLCELVAWEWFCDEIGHIYFRPAIDPESAAVYEIAEGVDIYSISYRISDAELYRNIVAWAKAEDGTAVKAITTWGPSDYNNLLPLKTLIINAGDLTTTAEGCAAIAAAEAEAIRPKVREVNFVAVGNPYLQIGDVIQVSESTTHASELYRILEISHHMEADGSPVFATALRCYHYGPA